MEEDILTQRINKLERMLKNGEIYFNDEDTIDSLLKIRVKPNGKIDPNTVNSTVKALLSSIDGSEIKKNKEKISILDIQLEYFKILDTFFGKPYKEMVKHKSSPHLIASSIANNKSTVNAYLKDASKFENGILDFWNEYGPILEMHVKELNCLKGVYGGDIFPTYKEKEGVCSSPNLYLDTVIYPDPFLRVAPFHNFLKPSDAIYYLVKHSLSALSLKPLIINHIKPPIAIIFPDFFQTDDSLKRFLGSIGNEDMIYHFQKIFKKKIINLDELNNILRKVTDLDSLKRLTKSEEKILFDSEWKDMSFDEKWHKYLSESKVDYSSINIEPVSEILKFYFSGRMTQANEIIYKSSRLQGTTIIDAPTSWQYFLWKYQYDYERSKKINPEIKNTFIVNALQSEDLIWLSKIPMKSIIELRKKGALEDMRNLLSSEVQSIDSINEDGFRDCLGTIKSNIEKALKNHKKDLESYSSGKKKFFGLDITPWIVTGGFSIVASLIGNVPLSVVAGSITLVTGCPSVGNIWKDGKKLFSDRSKIRKSPVGIFFNLKN
jgi:hypothetical protein